MKVLDLQCPHGHRFEGWFASTDDFEAQLSRKLVECPVCGATEVSRMPSAPRLNLSGATQTRPAESHALQAQVMRALREVLEKTENVGERFAEEARRSAGRAKSGSAAARRSIGNCAIASVRGSMRRATVCTITGPRRRSVRSH